MLHEREPNMLVDRKDLIEKLKENRSKHEDAYNTMCKGYAVLVEEANEEFQKLLREEFEAKRPHEVDHAEIYRKAFYLAKKPKEHLDDYDRTIEMLSWIEEDKIRISMTQFNQWVRDDWDWMGAFKREGELPILNSMKYSR